MIFMAVVVLAVWPGAAAQAAGRCGTHPWCDTSLSPGKRADLLLDALTPAERIGLLGGDEPGGVIGRSRHPHGRRGTACRASDLPPLNLTDGPVGVRQGPSTALPVVARAGRELRPSPGAPRRRPGRQRGQAQGQRRRLRPDDQHPAHAALGTRVREPRRGPVPHGPARRGVDPRPPGTGRDRERQALRGEQPGGPGEARRHADRQPLQGRRARRRAHPVRALPARSSRLR